MNTIREWLQGKKTYLTAFAGFLASIIAFGEGAIDEQGLGAALVALILAVTIGAKIDRAK
jgi:hypothetical protein